MKKFKFKVGDLVVLKDKTFPPGDNFNEGVRWYSFKKGQIGVIADYENGIRGNFYIVEHTGGKEGRASFYECDLRSYDTPKYKKLFDKINTVIKNLEKRCNVKIEYNIIYSEDL